MKQPTIQWANREASYKKTLKYLTARLEGKAVSIKTPWPKINAIGIDGWEFGSAIALCARPSCGKTTMQDEFCQKVFELNPDIKNLRVLKFELEMLSKVTAIREFSSILEKSYAYVCSAEEDIVINSWGQVTGEKQKISKQELIKCWEYVQNKLKKSADGKHLNPIDIVETSPTVVEFEQLIHRYMEEHKVDGEYSPTVVTIDHLRLIRKENNESEQQMMYSICLTINRLKKQYEDYIIFLGLNHLGRDVSKEDRCKPGEHANYLRDSDIFGSDSIGQNFDLIVVMDRPAARNISRYGPSNYIIDDPCILVFQFVKVRNGVPGMAFFKGEFNKMRIVEIDPPQKAKQAVSTR